MALCQWRLGIDQCQAPVRRVIFGLPITYSGLTEERGRFDQLHGLEPMIRPGEQCIVNVLILHTNHGSKFRDMFFPMALFLVPGAI